MLLMKQGEQGWLLTGGGGGNHEFARLFWCDPDGKGLKYRVGLGGASRLGTYELLGCDVTAEGVMLEWTGGRQSFIPQGWYQVSWVR